MGRFAQNFSFYPEGVLSTLLIATDLQAISCLVVLRLIGLLCAFVPLIM